MTAIAPATTGRYRFTVNGEPVEVAIPGGRRLLDVLRLDLGLTGTKEGCGEGECGACSVLLDGAVVDSCLVPVCQVDAHEVRTVEGLARGGKLDPLQAAFAATGGAQCGICTPGMLMAGRAFLEAAGELAAGGPAPTDEAIREAIAGNLCRCTGYTKIVEAIRLAAEGASAVPDVPAPPAERPVARAETPVFLADPPAISPGSLDEALRLMAEGGVRPVAGGTDLLVARPATDGGAAPEPYLDLWGLGELRGIRLEDGALVLGALTTYAELRRDSLVAANLPVLAEMAGLVGAAQIQGRGTLGGNAVTASPAGDSLPVLLAIDAELVAGSVRGERTVPAAAFFPTYRRTALAADELLLRIQVPLVEDRQVAYRKVGTRRAQAISKVALAVAWRWQAGTWRDVRVAAGSVAPTPIRCRATEAALEGESPAPDVAARAAAALAADISPIDDVRSTAAYRRAVAGRVLYRIVRDAGGW